MRSSVRAPICRIPTILDTSVLAFATVRNMDDQRAIALAGNRSPSRPDLVITLAMMMAWTTAEGAQQLAHKIANGAWRATQNKIANSYAIAVTM